MSRTTRPARNEYSPWYADYVDLVPDGDVVATLHEQLPGTVSLLRGLSDSEARATYAPGKWSIKTVIGHVADAERVFMYRALRFARGDRTPLPGYDENVFAAAAGCDERPLDALLAELAAVRAASIPLLNSLTTHDWSRSGQANGVDVTVRALAWITAGHELHHRRILRERYLERTTAT